MILRTMGEFFPLICSVSVQRDITVECELLFKGAICKTFTLKHFLNELK